MIPPLVSLIATAAQPAGRNAALNLFEQLKDGSDPTLAIDRMAAKSTELPKLPMNRLVPAGPGLPLVAKLLHLANDNLLVPQLHSPAAAMNVRAGLLIIHDYLDSAHTLVQSADDSDHTSAYWHAIIHRREPDYSNARYWLRRVGGHPIHAQLSRDVAALLNDSSFTARLRFDRLLDRQANWDPIAFVGLCQECAAVWDERSQAAAAVQEAEMRRLLEHCCHVAQG
jgi:hypothetical protein